MLIFFDIFVKEYPDWYKRWCFWHYWVDWYLLSIKKKLFFNWHYPEPPLYFSNTSEYLLPHCDICLLFYSYSPLNFLWEVKDFVIWSSTHILARVFIQKTLLVLYRRKQAHRNRVFITPETGRQMECDCSSQEYMLKYVITQNTYYSN